MKLEEQARAVFKRERQVFFRKDRPETGRRGKKAGRPEKQAHGLAGEDQLLFDALRAERTRIAKELGVPPYVVFPDTTLIAFATERPRNHRDLLGISGVGQSKLDRYGDAFLAVISEFINR
jgi:ATP-dependent DNA helicase RecQ